MPNKGKFFEFSVIFSTCVKGDSSNGVDFNDGSGTDDTRRRIFLLRWPSSEIFMPIKSSQSDEKRMKNIWMEKRSTSAVDFCAVVGEELSQKDEFVNALDWRWCRWLFWLLLALSIDIKAEFKVAWIRLWCRFTRRECWELQEPSSPTSFEINNICISEKRFNEHVKGGNLHAQMIALWLVNQICQTTA